MFKANATKGNKLDRPALDRVFASTELGLCPWDAERETQYEHALKVHPDEESKTQSSSGITLESWVGLWLKYFNTDIHTAFRDLVLIGYCGQLKDAIHLVKFKPKDVHGVAKSRKAFSCLVVGD